MGKLLATLLTCSSLWAAEKLPLTYQIAYGDPQAPIHITEYFSLSCPQCLKSFHKSFDILKHKYIDADLVYFCFHPNPADLLTLQAMVCLDELNDEKKTVFWEVVLGSLSDFQNVRTLQITMEALGKPMPYLDELPYLETAAAFRAAYDYLKQPDIVQELPTVEINGVLYEEFPHLKFVKEKINTLLAARRWEAGIKK